MSRQKGSRKAPKPVHEAYVDALHKRGRRERAPRRDRAEPISTSRRWGAVGVSTVMLLFAFAGVVTAIVERDAGNDTSARNAAIIAALIAPMAVYTLGLISRAAKPLRTTLVVAPASMAGFVLLAALLGEPATAVVAAFGIGGAFTLRADEGSAVARRLWVAGILAVLTLVAYRFLPDATIVVAPLFCFTASAVADATTDRVAKVRQD